MNNAKTNWASHQYFSVHIGDSSVDWLQVIASISN